MANQDQTPNDVAEVPADLTDSELEKVVGGDFIEIAPVAGESKDAKHKG